MNNGLRNATEKLANHRGFKILRYTIKGFLDNVAAKGIHTEHDCITPNSVGDTLDLLGRSVLKASLNKKVSKPIDHQIVSLSHNGIDNCVLLVSSTNLQFLL